MLGHNKVTDLNSTNERIQTTGFLLVSFHNVNKALGPDEINRGKHLVY
jgi:hypothetical protein